METWHATDFSCGRFPDAKEATYPILAVAEVLLRWKRLDEEGDSHDALGPLEAHPATQP